MTDGHVVNRILLVVIAFLEEVAASVVGFCIHVSNDEVVNALVPCAQRHGAGIGDPVANRDAIADIGDGAITDSHVMQNTQRAIAILIFWREQNGEAKLREASPGILHDVAFDQHTSSVLELKMVFYDERVPVLSAHKPGRPLHPNERFKEVIVANLDVFRSTGCPAATKDDVLASRFEIVVDDLVRAHSLVAEATSNRLRVPASP